LNVLSVSVYFELASHVLVFVSGQGFKFAPVAGSMLADLVQNKTPDLLVDEMRASRFVTKSKL